METEETQIPLYHSWKLNLVAVLLARDEDVFVYSEEGPYSKVSSLSNMLEGP